MSKEKKIKKDPKGTKLKKEFIFKLNEKDKAVYFDKSGVLHRQLAKLCIEFEALKDDWKAKIQAKTAERDTITSIAAAGEEKRTVEAIVVKDFDAREIKYYFEGECIETRSLSDHELQMEMGRIVNPKNSKEGLKDAGKVIADVSGKKAKSSDVADVIRMETGRKTKTSSVDGATRT